MITQIIGNIVGIALIAGVVIGTVGAYITHVIWWLQLAMSGQMDTNGEVVIAVLGTLVPPIGMIHGWMVWF